ncbi:MAG: hypothetical protein FI711_04825 [SAR202 cluster bacterium]|nr:hypothetical protein [Chloroflexota bacterium]MCH2510345.1 hypothetical protein [Dehalococcoidia bacterium]MQG48741.1 hypothetical protein [SAR202 cluster bacterium]MAQ54354.1 hypothetical protein [Chloroflexota bacterium]MCS5656739.1 hypothetical protein [Dehalococcoidia bacterium]|tara:strand:- start:3727 stop:4134 length:408 start_codon:yes stop_codon:yes gene_type:complete
MTLTVQGLYDGLATVANPEPATKRRSRDRQPFTPAPIVATVYWWWTQDGRTACMENQFSTMAATPIRFRCLGANGGKYPKRFRIDLAQALDPLPELNKREMKALGNAIVESLSRKLGVEVAAISPDIIDTVVDDA